MEQPYGLVKPFLMESAEKSVSARRSAGVRTPPIARFLRTVQSLCQRYLDMFLGSVLMLAGALKGQQLWADPSLGRVSGFPRELLIGATAFELALGGWLLAGLYRRLARQIALAWFTCLAAVALGQALGGAPSCACLGELQTQPWLMFSFDVAAVSALWMWSPNYHVFRMHVLNSSTHW